MSYSDTLIPSAKAVHDVAASGGQNNAQNYAILSTWYDIGLAASQPLFYTQVNTSTFSSKDLQEVLNILHTNGYSTSITGTTLTINF